MQKHVNVINNYVEEKGLDEEPDFLKAMAQIFLTIYHCQHFSHPLFGLTIATEMKTLLTFNWKYC